MQSRTYLPGTLLDPNTVLNGTGIHYNSMQGMNFIDILLNYLLTSGWDKFSWFILAQIYFFLSLDKLRDCLSYINHKIAICAKYLLETVGNQIYLYAMEKYLTYHVRLP